MQGLRAQTSTAMTNFSMSYLDFLENIYSLAVFNVVHNCKVREIVNEGPAKYFSKDLDPVTWQATVQTVSSNRTFHFHSHFLNENIKDWKWLEMEENQER